MAGSAMSAGLSVAFVVADGGPEEFIKGMKVVGVPKPKGRLRRMLFAPLSVYREAKRQNARIYKIHDPELLLLAPIARLFTGGKYVFDSHEDVPIQFLTKPYLTHSVRKRISWILKHVLGTLVARLDGVIGATPTIRNKLATYNSNAITICNYPILSEFQDVAENDQSRRSVTYVGNIGESRGIFETLEALALCKTDFDFELVGAFPQAATLEEAQAMQGWSRVSKYHGWVSRDQVSKVLTRTIVGLVNLRPHPNYMDALPVKLFEYMAAGVPVVISDFPLWRQIVEAADCGVLVDPMDPHAVAEAIDFLVENPDRAWEMGKNGQKAVRARFNWDEEEKNLIRFYRDLIDDAS